MSGTERGDSGRSSARSALAAPGTAILAPLRLPLSLPSAWPQWRRRLLAVGGNGGCEPGMAEGGCEELRQARGRATTSWFPQGSSSPLGAQWLPPEWVIMSACSPPLLGLGQRVSQVNGSHSKGGCIKGLTRLSEHTGSVYPLSRSNHLRLRSLG